MDFDAGSHVRARRLPCGCTPASICVRAGFHLRARRLSCGCPPAPNCLPALVRAAHNEIKGCKKMGNSSAGFFDVSESWPTIRKVRWRLQKMALGVLFSRNSHKSFGDSFESRNFAA